MPLTFGNSHVDSQRSPAYLFKGPSSADKTPELLDEQAYLVTDTPRPSQGACRPLWPCLHGKSLHASVSYNTSSTECGARLKLSDHQSRSYRYTLGLYAPKWRLFIHFMWSGAANSRSAALGSLRNQCFPSAFCGSWLLLYLGGPILGSLCEGSYHLGSMLGPLIVGNSRLVLHTSPRTSPEASRTNSQEGMRQEGTQAQVTGRRSECNGVGLGSLDARLVSFTAGS